MDKVTYITQFDKKAYRRYYLFHMFRKSKSIYFSLVLGALVLYLAINATISSKEFSTSLIFVWAIAVFTILMIPFMMFTRMLNDVKKDSEIRGDTKEFIEITKAKIERKIEGNPQKLVWGWHQLDSIYESKTSFMFYVDAYRALVVVKDKLTDDDITMLRKLITNNAPRNKKGKIKFKKVYKESK